MTLLRLLLETRIDIWSVEIHGPGTPVKQCALSEPPVDEQQQAAEAR